MIDLTSFLIIKPAQFNELLSNLNLSLSVNSDTYVLSLLFANFLAIVIMYLFYKIAMKIYEVLIPSKVRRFKLLWYGLSCIL